MGTYTFSQFKTFAKLHLGNNTEFESPINYYETWVNAAYTQLTTQDKFWGIRKSFYFPQLETSDTTKSTSDGVAYVTLPTDCLIVREVYDRTNDIHLKWMPWSEYVHKTNRTDTTAEGESSYWVRQGSSIYLYPTPDGTHALTIYYRKVPAILTASATTAIGVEWDEAILSLAVYKAFMWTGEYEKAKIFKQEFLDTVAGIVTIYSQEEKARDEVWRIDPAYKVAGYE